jgi:hypothetical protein
MFEAHQEMKTLSLPEQADAIVIAGRPIALQSQRWGWATICSRPCSSRHSAH